MADSQPRFRQLSVLFQDAISLPPGSEREAFLTAACGSDTELRNELARLIAADASLQQKASSTPVRLPRFGIFQARELIGSGGMGAVYRATREDGEVRQTVAIKAIASVFLSPILDERLRKERQILAELHHPNIAAFLDGGLTEDGFPYLVMEYVQGEPIDKWCNAQKLTIPQRLELFLKVCTAVSFAHQRLIVHRDLKPANILVTAGGEPKLLDFGVARTLVPDAGATQATSNLFLTPLYASPEMLRGQAATIFADVYSLGVLLYELLSGERPFGRGAVTPVEIIETVLSSEPRPLSDAAPASLARRLRGDLAAIVSKAMAKSPEDRYASVEQFADDIRRHLAGHPIQAAHATPIYRARKFVARHKSSVAAAALVTLSLVAGLIATLWQARVSERRFADAHELARYLMFDLQKAVEKLPGATPLKAEMVQRSLNYLDRLSSEKINDPVLRTEVGQGYTELGGVLGNPFMPNLGEVAKARESYRKAIAILQPVAAQNPNNRQARLTLARAKLQLGRSIGYQVNEAEGLKLVREAAMDLARMVEQSPNDFDTRYEAWLAFDSLARALGLSNGYVNASALNPALDALRTAIAHMDAASKLRPEDWRPYRDLAMSYKLQGDLMELHDRPAATTFYQQGLAALDRIPAKDREAPLVLTARSSMLLGLGWNLGNLGETAPALQALDEARQIRDRISEQDPNNVMALYFRTIPYRNLGIVSGYAGRTADKLRYFLTAIDICTQILAKQPDNKVCLFSQADLQADSANLSVELKHPQEAERLARAGITTLKQVAANPQATSVELAITARALLETKVPGMADPALGLELAKRSVALAPKDAESLEILAEAYWRNGDRAAAVQSMEQSLALIEPTPTPARKAFEKTLAEYRTAPLLKH